MEQHQIDLSKDRVNSSSNSFTSFLTNLVSIKEQHISESRRKIESLNEKDDDHQKQLVKKRVLFKIISFVFCFSLIVLIYMSEIAGGNKIEIFSAPYIIIICLTLLYFRLDGISKELHKFTPSQKITREEEHLFLLESELQDLNTLKSDYTSLNREFNKLVANIEENKENN